MILTVPADLFDPAVRDSVSKHNLYDLIYVLQEGCPHYGGAEYRIGNTPQQGINWIGQPQNLKGFIINAARSYAQDNWIDKPLITTATRLRSAWGSSIMRNWLTACS